MTIFSYRIATLEDIPAMQAIRLAVKENVLSDPSKVTFEMYVDYLDKVGRTWVCEYQGNIVGFASANKTTANIWALFLDSNFEGQGIGQHLMACMLTWLTELKHQQANLSTDSGTRAEQFYLKNGWQLTQRHSDGEVEFVKALITD